VKTGTVTWTPFDRLPEVKKFSAKTFLVAFENLSTGKVYTSTADYLNAYRLQYEDDCGNKPNECPCEDGDGCPTTGWFDSVPSDEYDRFYTKLIDGKYVRYLAWAEYPKYRAGKKKPTPSPNRHPRTGEANETLRR